MASNAVHTAIAQLFSRAGATPDPETLRRYESALAKFGSEFAPAEAGDPHLYADSLVAAGLLQRRIVPLSPYGSRTEYRRPASVEVAA